MNSYLDQLNQDTENFYKSLSQANAPQQSQQGLLGDSVDALQMGALSASAGLFNLIGADGIADSLQRFSDDQLNQMSATGRAAMQKEFITEDEQGRISLGDAVTDLDAWVLNLANVVGQFVPTAIPGGAAAKGLSTVAKLGAKGKALVTSGAMGTLGGAAATGQAGLQAQHIIENMADEDLVQSAPFQQHFKQLRAAQPNGDLEQLFEQAKTAVKEQIEAEVMTDPKLLVANFAASAIGDPIIAKSFGRALGGSLKASIAKGFVTEGASEFAQGATEHYTVREHAQKVDPTLDPNKGMIASGLNEALIGGTMGGTMAAVGHVRMPKPAATGDAALDAAQQQTADLVNSISANKEAQAAQAQVAAQTAEPNVVQASNTYTAPELDQQLTNSMEQVNQWENKHLDAMQKQQQKISHAIPQGLHSTIAAARVLDFQKTQGYEKQYKQDQNITNFKQGLLSVLTTNSLVAPAPLDQAPLAEDIPDNIDPETGELITTVNSEQARQDYLAEQQQQRMAPVAMPAPQTEADKTKAYLDAEKRRKEQAKLEAAQDYVDTLSNQRQQARSKLLSNNKKPLGTAPEFESLLNDAIAIDPQGMDNHLARFAKSEQSPADIETLQQAAFDIAATGDATQSRLQNHINAQPNKQQRIEQAKAKQFNEDNLTSAKLAQEAQARIRRTETQNKAWADAEQKRFDEEAAANTPAGKIQARKAEAVRVVDNIINQNNAAKVNEKLAQKQFSQEQEPSLQAVRDADYGKAEVQQAEFERQQQTGEAIKQRLAERQQSVKTNSGVKLVDRRIASHQLQQLAKKLKPKRKAFKKQLRQAGASPRTELKLGNALESVDKGLPNNYQPSSAMADAFNAATQQGDNAKAQAIARVDVAKERELARIKDARERAQTKQQLETAIKTWFADDASAWSETNQKAVNVESVHQYSGDNITLPEVAPITEQTSESDVYNTDAIQDDNQALDTGLSTETVDNLADESKQLDNEPRVTHTTKKGKELVGVVRDIAREDAQAIDPYTFKKDGGYFIREKHLTETNGSDSSVPSTRQRAESNSETGPVRESVEQKPVSDESRNAESYTEQASRNAEPARTQRQGSDSVSEDSASDGRAESDQRIYNDNGEFGTAQGPARSEQSGRSDTDSPSRSSTEQTRAATAKPAITKANAELEKRLAAQAEANQNPPTHIAADEQNIAASIPLLLDEQQGDVAFAERRLENERGVLFTNGTGTGKTFTGLGTIKRSIQQGKDNVLIVVPGDKIAKDWVKSGKLLGVDVKQLENTKDNGGSGVVVTSYANFRQNTSLAKRDWDLIVTDESHNLLAKDEFKATSNLVALRVLSGHERGRNSAVDFKEPALKDELNRINEALAEADEKGNEAEIQALEKERSDAFDHYKVRQRHWAEHYAKRWDNQDTKVVFLSATPFAYRKSIDYAEGFLFHYNELASGQNTRDSYNTGDYRDQFFVSNFGYRMRYNKLTEPDADVDVSLMEREFNNKLRESGAVRSRMLEVEKDYDRKFILVDDAVGAKIDDGLNWLREQSDKYKDNDDLRAGFRELESAVNDNFDYLNRAFLLESIKAKHAVKHINEHLALGRKVVVFHDFNKGGGFHPFERSRLQLSTPAAEDAYHIFQNERPELMRLPLRDLKSPHATLKAAFGDRLLSFNGNVSKREKNKNVELFNEDNSGKDIILVQSDAGGAGISLHDTTGVHQRTLFNLGLPVKPTLSIQIEGRTYRVGLQSDAMFRYFSTGLSMERYMVASKLAERSGTAENLAMGDQARALKQNYIDAYEDAGDYPAGMASEGVGGKAWDRSTVEAASDFERAKTFYFAQQKKTSKNKAQEGADYFATPEPVGLKMVQWAQLKAGETALEPSAGHGAIARWVDDTVKLNMVEPSYELASKAKLNASHGEIHNQAFEDYNLVNKAHAVVMNPPFNDNGAKKSHGGKLAFEHVAKAFKHLKTGGRLIAIVPEGPLANKHWQKWYESKEAKDVDWVAEVNLPSSTFNRAGTTVRTRILVLDKVPQKQQSSRMTRTIDLSYIENNKELFDRLEDISMPERFSGDDTAGNSVPSSVNFSKQQARPLSDKELNSARVTLNKKVVALELQKFANEFKGLKGEDGKGTEVRILRHPFDVTEWGGESAVRAAGAERASGAYETKSNTLYLFTDNIHTKGELQKTIRHELLVHKGLGLFTKENQKAILEKINSSRKTLDPRVKKIWQNIDKNYSTAPELVKAEEFLARLAETNFNNQPWHKRLLEKLGDAFISLLQKLRFIDKNTATYAAMKDLVADIEIRLRRGDSPEPRPPSGPDGDLLFRKDGEVKSHFDKLNSAMDAALNGVVNLKNLSKEDQAELKKSAGDRAHSLYAKHRSKVLGLMPRTYLTDVAKKLTPIYKAAVDAFQQTIQKMDALRSNLQEISFDQVKTWQELHDKDPDNGKLFAELLHDATLENVDPSLTEYQAAMTESQFLAIKKKLFNKVMESKSLDDQHTFSQTVNAAQAALLREESGQRFEAWQELSARFKALPPEWQAQFNTVVEAYKKQSETKFSVFKQRIKEETENKQYAKRMLDLWQVQYEMNHQRGFYVPLQRFGEYSGIVKRPDTDTEKGETLEFSLFENEYEQKKWLEEKREEYGTQGVEISGGKKAQFNQALDGVSASFMRELLPKLSKSLSEDVYQLYLEHLPDLSMRKHFIRRKGTKGFSQDAIKAFAHNTFHGAYEISKLAYSHRLDKGLSIMRDHTNKQASVEDNNKARDLTSEFESRHNWIMNPTGSTLATNLTSFGFLYYLGVSPAAAMVNLSQTPLVAFPVLASRYGFKQAGKMLLQASKELIKGKGHLDKSNTLTREEQRAMKYFVSSGLVSKSMAHDLAGVAEGGQSYNPTADKWMSRASYLFHHAERLNREATAMAAFRLARSKGKKFKEAMQEAHDLTIESHFDYSSANRARYMQNDFAKVLLLFRQYSLNMTIRLWRDFKNQFSSNKAEAAQAKKQFWGMMGMTALFAGAAGLPLYSVLTGLANLFGDDEDEPWNADLALRQGLGSMLGEDMARIVMNGLMSESGANIQSRVSLNNLWLREPNRDMDGRDQVAYYAEQFLGPVYGLALSAGMASTLAKEDHTYRAVEYALPKFAKDILKAGRYNSEGVQNLRGDEIVAADDMNLWDIVVQASGYSPTKVGDAYSKNSSIKGAEQKILARRRLLLNRYALAKRLGDTERQQEVLTMIERYNQANPEYPLTRATLLKSLKRRKAYSEKAQNGIVINPNLQHVATEYALYGVQ